MRFITQGLSFPCYHVASVFFLIQLRGWIMYSYYVPSDEQFFEQYFTFLVM